MRHPARRSVARGATWLLCAALLVVALLGSTGAAGRPSGPASTKSAVQLRVDQLGYLPSDAKLAYLMSPSPLQGESYAVVDGTGDAVDSGPVTTSSRGSWNASYRYVYPIDFSTLSAPGRYWLVVSGPAAVRSAPFEVGSAQALYSQLVSDGVNFFANQRDGSDIIAGALGRRRSHLHDSRALVYADPRFRPGGSDVIRGGLTRIGGPVNVSGGWFDAGDYLKFTFTASYADVLLYEATRALGATAPARLIEEADYGTRWLNRMWNARSRTLYLQVGIGSGNETTFYGDHDLWRLPQRDDSDRRPMDRFAAAHRPVFEAARPGHKIDPDIVGRLSAAFALAAQADAGTDRPAARRELARAMSAYAMADVHPPRQLASTLPASYYPESIWHDAMELGAIEIVLAEQRLGLKPAAYLPYLRQAATWASDYIRSDAGKDTLNLYDVSALAHSDLITAIRQAGRVSGMAVSVPALIADLKLQLSTPARRAATDIFHAGGDYTNFDVDSHTFGFISSAALYQRASGDRQFAPLAAQQRDWLFGDNPWGESFMVGIGTTFPRCMQSQIPNLAGSLNGQPPIDAGAVVNGPNLRSNFSGGLGGLQTGMRKCEDDYGEAFTGHGSEFVDDVRAWQTDEPALDMTASAILAGALEIELGH